MKSKTIQDNFKEVYEKLFSQCPLVVSVPGDFFWAGEHAVDYGGIGISQHLPLRIYVGLKPNELGIFRLVDFREFIASKFHFTDVNLREFNFDRFFAYLNKEKQSAGGWDVCVVTEIPTSCGLNSLGAFSAAISLLFHLTEGKISKANFNKWQQTKVSKIVSDPDFNLVFRLAWKLNSLIHSGYCPPIRAFVPFVESEFPIFCTSENVLNQQDFFNKIDNVNYLAGSMDELCDLEPMVNWPIDIALIYSGEIRPSDLLFRSIFQERNQQRKVYDTVKKSLEKTASLKESLIWKSVTGQTDLWHHHLNSLVAISLEVFQALKQSLDERTESAVESLFSAVRHYNYGLRILNLATGWTNHIMEHLLSYSWKNGTMTGATKLTGAGRGGDILFLSFAYDFRESFDQVVENIRQIDPSKKVFVDYASWLDGFEHAGAILEQDLSQKISSHWITSNSCLVLRLDADGKISQSILAPSEIESMQKQAPILLDKINHRIFIEGKRLTSHEINTASATIDVFELLMSNIGKGISNKALSRSIYSLDRNEFQSKIIHPIRKIYKEITGSDLSLEIHGSIHDFIINLNSGSEICLVKKLS